MVLAAQQRLAVDLVTDDGQHDGVPGGHRGVPPDPLQGLTSAKLAAPCADSKMLIALSTWSTAQPVSARTRARVTKPG